MARRVDRRSLDVAVRADLRHGSLAREELLSMTIQAGCMFGELGYIGKRSVAFANFLPVLRWNFVTCTTREFLIRNVSGVRETGVINARLRTSLTRGRSAAQNNTKH